MQFSAFCSILPVSTLFLGQHQQSPTNVLTLGQVLSSFQQTWSTRNLI